MLRSGLKVLAILGISAAGIAQADAGALYAAGFGGHGLYTIDSATGAITSTGDAANDLDQGLGYDPNSGIMYGLDGSSLYTVNITTGIRTLVANTSVFSTALAYNQTNNTMYTLSNSRLATIDLGTGAVTLIGSGSIGSNTCCTLAIDSAGNIFAGGLINGEIYAVDALTGVGSLLFSSVTANIGGGTNGFTALAFDENDDLYGVTTFNDFLVKVDLVSGTSATIGPSLGGTDQDVRALEFVRNSATTVAEPVTLASFGLGLVGLGMMWRRRKT